MKRINILFLLVLVSLFGCQAIKVPPSQIYTSHKPEGLCEIVGQKTAFEFKQGYDIVYLQPIVRNSRIVILLGDAGDNIDAFLMQSTRPFNETAKAEFTDTVTLSTPGYVLKLEEHSAERESVRYMGKSYRAYVSYNKRDWIPLAKARFNSKTLQRDLSLMERAWRRALRLEYVRSCINFDANDSQTVNKMRSIILNCYIDNELCSLAWESWGDWNGGSANEFNEPPFHDNWYPDDIRGGLGSGGGGAVDCNPPPVNAPPKGPTCDGLLRTGNGTADTHDMAIIRAGEDLDYKCRTRGGTCGNDEASACENSDGTWYAYALGYCKCIEVEGLCLELPTGEPPRR